MCNHLGHTTECKVIVIVFLVSFYRVREGKLATQVINNN